MAGTAGPRIVIVGAGLLGAAVAYELGRAGAAPTVIEAGRPGGGTSGATFGWVNAQDKEPAGYFALNAEGVEAYPRLARELGGSSYHPGGDLAIALDPATAEALQARVERHRAKGYPVELLTRDAVLALEPDLRLEGGEVLVAHFFAEGWVGATALVEELLSAAMARGAQLVTATVEALTTDSGRITGLGLGSGERLAADLVLLAAGPQTEALAALAGVGLPMAPTPGLLAVTAPSSASIRHVVHAGGVTMRPDGGGRLMLSSRALDAKLHPSTTSMAAESASCRELLARAARVVRGLEGSRIETARIGIRSVARDGLPVAGFAAELQNLYLLVSHSGATLAPVLGRLVAAELLGEPQAKLAPYRPDRFRGAA